MPVVPGDLPPPLDVHLAAEYWIDAATTEIDAQKWICAGKDPDDGIVMLASHYLTISPSGGGLLGPGMPVSESRGGVTLTVSQGGAANGPHAGSSFGQNYDQTLAGICGKRRRQLPPPPQPQA